MHIIPTDRARPEPSLYDIPRERLELARHTAANRATVALLLNQVSNARQWQRVVTDCDSELNRESVA